ncbi:MAG: signal recognition particle-docking protein FtsY [Planctomycetes bacterium]|nr:signal recognition particle-docking protein FtsY [Planctomycetota bacterium]MBI3833038.1 signal recognition particle-docking protein FtsY [Planctomycetota bacterium]
MGLFDRFKQGLTRTREKIAASFRSIVRIGRKIDQESIDRLETAMLSADFGPATTKKLIDLVSGAWKKGEIVEEQQVTDYLRTHITDLWPEADRQIHYAESGPTVVLVTGINGSGKTTSVAKLGQYFTNQKKKVLLGACDTFRAAAVEQLTVWSKRIGVDVVKHAQGADPGAVAYDACEAALARKVDVLLIDTAGRLHTQDHLMRELGKIQKVVERKIPGAPHEVLLVLDATIGQNALNQAKQFAEHVSLTGIFLAKLDGSAKGGVVVGIRDQLNVPMKFVGLGETPTDIEPFDPAVFVQALFAEP